MNSTSKALPSSSSSSSASSASNNNNKSIIPVPVWGIYRDEKIPSRNVLQLDRIERGLDVRTTLMLKNIPNRMTDLALMDYIDEVCLFSCRFFFFSLQMKLTSLILNRLLVEELMISFIFELISVRNVLSVVSLAPHSFSLSFF